MHENIEKIYFIKIVFISIILIETNTIFIKLIGALNLLIEVWDSSASGQGRAVLEFT